MFETASTLTLFSTEVVVAGAAATALFAALLLFALKEVKAKKMVSRHTKDVGKKIFFTNLVFFEVIGKRCGCKNIMHDHESQTFPSIFSAAGQIYAETLAWRGFVR